MIEAAAGRRVTAVLGVGADDDGGRGDGNSKVSGGLADACYF